MTNHDYLAEVQETAEPYRNRILDAVSPSGLESLAPFLETVTLDRRQDIVRPHEEPEHVYFPVSCVISWLSTLRTGATIEVATIGNEGVVGAPQIHGGRMFPFLVMNQVPGMAMRLSVDLFEKALTANLELQGVMAAYAHAFMGQVGQSGACNGLHSVSARCARWLLMTQDRVGAAEFGMTHE